MRGKTDWITLVTGEPRSALAYYNWNELARQCNIKGTALLFLWKWNHSPQQLKVRMVNVELLQWKLNSINLYRRKYCNAHLQPLTASPNLFYSRKNKTNTIFHLRTCAKIATYTKIRGEDISESRRRSLEQALHRYHGTRLTELPWTLRSCLRSWWSSWHNPECSCKAHPFDRTASSYVFGRCPMGMTRYQIQLSRPKKLY